MANESASWPVSNAFTNGLDDNRMNLVLVVWQESCWTVLLSGEIYLLIEEAELRLSNLERRQ
jgi:hypothetical protein